MNIKRFCGVLLALCLTAALCACNSGAEKKYIAVIVKSVDSDFFYSMKSGVEVAATEYNVNFTFEGPENEEDYLTQNALIEKAVENKADVIVLSAIDYEKSASAIENAAKNGVRTITVDSGSASDAVSLFIGTDNGQAGEKAAEAAVSGFSEMSEIRIGLVNYFESTDNGIRREEGFRRYLENVPNAQIVAAVNVESNIESATEGAASMLRENPQINVIVGFNEWMTLGVGYAIRELGLSESVRGVGFDSNTVSVGMIETGEMDALIVQNPFAMGYLSIKNATELTAGIQPDSPELYTAVIAVTQENMFDSDIQKIVFRFN